MPSCAVKWCINRCHVHKKNAGITFHTFPKDENKKLQWTKAVRLERQDREWTPSKNRRICSMHFKKDDFYETKKGMTYLKSNAVPICTMVFSNTEPVQSTPLLTLKSSPKPKTVNPEGLMSLEMLPLTPSLRIKSNSNKENVIDKPNPNPDNDLKSTKCLSVACPSCGCKFSVPVDSATKDLGRPVQSSPLTNLNVLDTRCGTPLNIPSSDIESALDTPKTYKLKKLVQKKTILSEKRLTKIRNLKRQNTRLLKKNLSLKDITTALKKNKLVENSAHISLNEISGDIFSMLKKKQKANGKKTIHKFTPAVKKFALTLNYYSPSGYQYVRKQFQSCLPHPSTLSKWYQAIDAKPGFTEEAFRALRSKFSHSEKNLACLMVDEMAIRQQKIFNGEDIDGLVTFGPINQIATQVYVLMLVALNDSFKLPLGYFLISGMTAEQRANIIKMCLRKCYEVGADVVSLTFDGCPANLATANLLGCNFENPNDLKTYFTHPENGRQVVVFLDPCHMLKLVRNTFESKKGFVDENGCSIEWRFLQELKKVQDNLGLHFANKLTERHLNFRNNIMNVKLATQLLSNSVATALELCSDELNLPEFKDVSPTVKFLQTMNNLFDILNTSSLNNKGFQHPIGIKDKEFFLNFLDEAESYILGLKVRVPSITRRTVNGRKIILRSLVQKNVIQTKSKTGFLGLMVCIKSFRRLFDELVVETKVLQYILCYKFSQDHLELFFGLIRNHGRCNNNPNARQFMGIYRKTLQNLELSSKFTGNSVPLEHFPVLNCTSSSIKLINETTIGFRFDGNDEPRQNVLPTTEENNCDVFSTMLDSNKQLPDTIEQIIGYISGFVAKKLSSKINCEKCTESLFANEKLYFHKFISLKDFGGLAYPSVILYKVCYRAECVLRNIMKIQSGKCLTSKHNLTIISNKCFQCVTSYNDIFKYLKEHPADTRSHDILFIKSIIHVFLKIRLHYIAKNDSLLHSSRQKLNKLTIFRGT